MGILYQISLIVDLIVRSIYLRNCLVGKDHGYKICCEDLSFCILDEDVNTQTFVNDPRYDCSVLVKAVTQLCS